ncbi:TAXI family TRAP transporter solute-binding subunit [Dactylosporangium sucinum]|uniref:TAXI family TRAP transporter solute-binding subunit n=1 Tax=Dactylosporangium sucinum TaxID=1424081 RepID=A0A917WXC3_9ACTN|nr:TAXI family TRAP transporter solute-binding subunit [Dactylosporangium sucinum]GGM36698.1 hypothetical protein GCM10007977_042740 [Dactylosporangium sucinum]
MDTTTGTLTWLGGNPGDGWYEMTGRLLGLLRETSTGLRFALAAGGGEHNLHDVAAGQAEIAMSIDVVVAAAYNGGPPFREPLRNLNCLGTGWSPLPYNLLAARDQQASFPEAVAGRRIRVGAPPTDTTDELMFQQVLSHYATSYNDITAAGGHVLLAGYDTLVAALHAGDIDFVFGATTLPAPSIARAAHGPRPIDLAPLPTDVIKHLASRFGAKPGVIPAGTYPGLQTSDVPTCFVDTVFVISADVPEPIAYEVTQLLLDNLDQLPTVHGSLAGFNPFVAWRLLPAPLHPGAARAYRDRGYM